MSLKSFHLVFTSATIILFIFLAGYYGLQYLETKSYIHAFTSILSIIITCLGIFYFKNFITKYKSISYL
ncbi:MAG: hypothetical protein CMF96_09285 [Candidatus Marinimicrobia bacterium]|nr:hypothetical protein [Candidatus Neomarinimicrobiota bacterium]